MWAGQEFPLDFREALAGSIDADEISLNLRKSRVKFGKNTRAISRNNIPRRSCDGSRCRSIVWRRAKFIKYPVKVWVDPGKDAVAVAFVPMKLPLTYAPSVNNSIPNAPSSTRGLMSYPDYRSRRY